MKQVLVGIAMFQVLLVLVGLGRAKVLALLLSPSGLGVVGTIDHFVVSVVQLGTFGVSFAALKYMSQAHGEGDERFRMSVAGFAQSLLGLAMLSTLAILAALAWVPDWFGAGLAPYLSYMRIAAWSVPSAVFCILVANVLAAATRPLQAACFNFLAAFSLAFGGIGGFVIDNVAGLYYGSAIVGAATMIAGSWHLRKAIGVRWWAPSRAVGWSNFRTIFSTSLALYVILLVATVSTFAIRYIVLSRLGEAAAGLFQSAMSIALTGSAILVPLVNFYLIPALNRKDAVEVKADSADNFNVRVILFMSIGVIPAVCFPYTLLSLLFSSEFKPAGSMLFVFVLWQCAFQIAHVYQQLLIGLNDMAWAAVMATLGFTTSTFLAVSLVSELGLVGAPISLALGTVLYIALLVIRLRVGHGIAISWGVVVRMGWLFAIVIVGGSIFRNNDESSLEGLTQRFIFALLVLILTSVLYLRASFVLPEQIRRFLKILKR